MQEVLKGVLGAHHHTVLADGSDPVRGTVKGSGLAQGNAEGIGLAQGTEGTGLAQGIAGGSAHAQGTQEGVEIDPGHRLAMGTIRQTRKHLPCDETSLRASRYCVNN